MSQFDDDASVAADSVPNEADAASKEDKTSRRNVWATKLRNMPLWLVTIIGFVCLSAVVVVAASRPSGRPQPPVITTTPTATFTPPPVNGNLNSPPPLSPLTQTITYLEDKYQTALGVSIAPIAPAGQQFMRPWVGGSLVTGYAWATADVPVALAVLREPREPNDPDYLLTKAFNESSGAGDLALWQYLGTDAVAAEKTQGIIVEAGDLNTTVRSTTDVPDEAPFVRTRWALSDQAMFLGAFYCMSESDRVLTHMRQPSYDDSYGLGLLPGVQVKSGTGTEPNGVNSIRQAALIDVPLGTPYAVAVYAVAVDGTLSTAKAALNELAPAIAVLTNGMDGYC